MKPLPEPQSPILPSRSHHSIVISGRLGESALLVLREARESPLGLLVVASNERKAEELVRLLRTLAPDLSPIFFPGWDCLPYDRASPSRPVMGQRIAALKTLMNGDTIAPVVVTTPASVLQRIPPTDELAQAELVMRPGDDLPLEVISEQLRRLGYIFDERVDEPGEVALRGQVVDIFPAGAEQPIRLEHQNGRIEVMRPFDPASQLASGECSELRLLPASECFITGDGAEDAPITVSEHRLPEHFDRLDTLFTLLPDARIILDLKVESRIATTLAQFNDAYESRIKLRGGKEDGGRPLPPDSLYLTEAEWNRHLQTHIVRRIVAEPDNPDLAPPPLFATETRAFRDFADFVKLERDEGYRVVLAASGKAERRPLIRALQDDVEVFDEAATTWSDVEQSQPGQVIVLDAELDEGFRDAASKSVIITAADVMGSRARGAVDPMIRPIASAEMDLEFGIGDIVVHREHGLGVLNGIESVDTEGATKDLLRLTYAQDATLMVPAEEMDQLWRYGASADAVTLDRIDSDAWAKRRIKVEEEIAESASRLMEAVIARKSKTAPKLSPPRALYERFASQFSYAETPDQASTIAAVLKDLESGQPMNRLVCGDVGFGKTEVALRAAAAAALDGKQVAVVAPTTVLVRQHVQTFEQRFAGFDIGIGHLSRLVGPTESKAVKAGLADGSSRIVIGTHALVGKGVNFADLGLVIIDEEQRFGAAHKAKLKALAKDVHVLTLTATPIPRTLQSATVGIQDLSIIATPPSRRQPIRTFLIPFDDGTVREALMREQRRGGQSFVVCPRIDDIDAMTKRLANLVPELQTFVVHGDMPADEIDDAMVRFADGEGDVLLATNIIESGLDVPRANTMLVWRPDRFGLAQLHQLRGRVGRGRVRGAAYLLTDPAHPLARSTQKRLETMESLDRLGAGFAISAQDLDQRGAGDLFGEDQAGHMKLIGASLYQHLLAKALAAVRGEKQADDSPLEMNMNVSGHIPTDYVPEPEIRINLHARLARLSTAEDVDAFEDEIRNRFGTPPEPVDNLIALARLRAQCRLYGISRVDAGPQAVALSFKTPDKPMIERVIAGSKGVLEYRNDRLIWKQPSGTPHERLTNATQVLKFLAKADRPR